MSEILCLKLLRKFLISAHKCAICTVFVLSGYVICGPFCFCFVCLQCSTYGHFLVGFLECAGRVTVVMSYMMGLSASIDNILHYKKQVQCIIPSMLTKYRPLGCIAYRRNHVNSVTSPASIVDPREFFFLHALSQGTGLHCYICKWNLFFINKSIYREHYIFLFSLHDPVNQSAKAQSEWSLFTNSDQWMLSTSGHYIYCSSIIYHYEGKAYVTHLLIQGSIHWGKFLAFSLVEVIMECLCFWNTYWTLSVLMCSVTYELCQLYELCAFYEFLYLMHFEFNQQHFIPGKDHSAQELLYFFQTSYVLCKPKFLG